MNSINSNTRNESGDVMPVYIKPEVGSYGKFSVKPPFDTVFDPNVIYQCQAVRSISDMVAGGDDPLGTIYEPAGLTKADFDLDVANGVSIVTLVAGGAKYLDIPNSYLESGPISTGKTYQSKAISVNLKSLPVDSVDLNALATSISNLVHNTIGITPVVDVLDTSPEVKVDDATHQANETTRLANISNHKDYKTLYEETLQIVNQNALYIAELEAMLKQ